VPRHLLNTRPAEDAAALTQALEALGHRVTASPLLDIQFVADDALDLAGVAGLLATSANGVRAFARAGTRRDLPLYAVGDATARAASEAGFDQVRSAAGDVETLASLVIGQCDPAAGALLHVAGTRVAGDLAGRLEAAGFDVRRAILYRAEAAKNLSDAVLAGLNEGTIDGVMFFSPRTARQFVTLLTDAGLETAAASADVFCLSAAVADAANLLNWRTVYTAARPDQDALLRLIDEATD
jgi:uroporphyrinogen-III synthase